MSKPESFNGPTYTSTMARIEQGVARGWTLDQICDRLAVDPSDVDRALARMDAANASSTRPCPRGRVA